MVITYHIFRRTDRKSVTSDCRTEKIAIYARWYILDNNRLTQQKDLLKTVLEVSSILKQQRRDLDIIIRQLAEVQTVLTKDDLSSDDLK